MADSPPKRRGMLHKGGEGELLHRFSSSIPGVQTSHLLNSTVPSPLPPSPPDGCAVHTPPLRPHGHERRSSSSRPGPTAAERFFADQPRAAHRRSGVDGEEMGPGTTTKGHHRRHYPSPTPPLRPPPQRYVTRGGKYVERGIDGTIGRVLLYKEAKELPHYDPATHLRVVCISDTHGHHRDLQVPPGDVLLHAGDVFRSSRKATPSEGLALLKEFNGWLDGLPHRCKFVVGGNHDAIFEALGKDRVRELLTGGIYLEYDSVMLDDGDLTIYGAPISQGASCNRAFQPRAWNGDPALHKLPPLGAYHDIILTHEPGQNSLLSNYLQGCSTDAKTGRAVRTQAFPPPCAVHVGGHIHHNGVRVNRAGVLRIVACNVRRHRELDPESPAVVFDWPRRSTRTVSGLLTTTISSSDATPPGAGSVSGGAPMPPSKEPHRLRAGEIPSPSSPVPPSSASASSSSPTPPPTSSTQSLSDDGAADW